MKVQMKNLHGTEQETAPFPPISSLNNNILICGSSGTGKSTLLQLIERLKPPKLKIIFKQDSEKALSVEKNRPFHEEDRINFLDAWQEAQQADTQGYMLIQEQILMEDIRKQGQSLGELRKEIQERLKKAENIDKAILQTIQHKINNLYPYAPKNNSQGHKLSMEGLTELEYQFFSDYILRSQYEQIMGEIISIDEIHRLKPLMAGLLTRISREIRSRGGFLATTQSLSDLPPEMLNNFGSIYLFPTLDRRDLDFLDKLHGELRETILQNDDHEFMEIRSFPKLRTQGRAYKMEVIE